MRLESQFKSDAQYGSRPALVALTEITREVEGVLECWCYGQHSAPTNSRDGSILNSFDLPQHADELLLIVSSLRPHLA